MIRRFDSDKPAFVLDTQKTTYAFRVLPSGHLEQLWYGRKIWLDSPSSLEPLAEKRIFEPGNAICYSPEYKTVVPEDMCLEMSSGGHGDLREPFIEVVNPDGSRSSDFLYKSDEILSEKSLYSPMPGAYNEDGSSEHLIVTLEDKASALTLELHYFVYPECDVICRSARLVNNSKEKIELERLMSMQLDLPAGGYMITSFHGAWAREMGKFTAPLDAGQYVIQSRAGSSSSRANPFFMLHSPDTSENVGDCYGFNLIYSGNHYESAEVNAYGKTRIVSGINPSGFCWLLCPGESFYTPEAVMTYSSEGFSGQSVNMQRFVREHIVRGRWKKKPRPVLLNSWEACYMNISESTLVSMAEDAKKLGIEMLVMDDGWFGERSEDNKALGDWFPNKKKLPGGLEGLAKKINKTGLELGIWVEPEMVNVDSRLYKDHPDWVMEIPGRLHSEGRNQRILDLANPKVCDWIIETMSGIFSSANIAYVKWDYNRVFSDVFSPYLPKERKGETAHRYICGLYRVMKSLTEKFPDILFEGCASGGNRFDLGILCYFPQIWASDNTDAICRASIQEGYSYGYPMSVVSAHVSASPNHQTMRRTPTATRFNVACFGVLGYELDLRDLKPEHRQMVKEQVELYKKWRELLQFGDFYRGRTGNLHEWTCVSQDKKQAVGLLLQELASANTQFERFFASGLDPQKMYSFRLHEQRLNLKYFGSLINTMTPIHVRTDSMIHNAIARVVKLTTEKESFTAPGDVLMRSGVKLSQGFSGTGYNDQVRVFQDFASRLYFIEETED